MSTEQSEVSETPHVDITQQATTPTPTTAPKSAKNPKRVAAGKLVAERTRLAREQQKKAAAEAAIIIANNKTKAPEPTPPSEYATPPSEYETPKSTKVDKGGIPPNPLGVTQWIGVISIVVSLIGIYYKREELKAAFSKKKTPEPINKVDESQPVRLTVFRKNTPEQQPARAKQPRGVKHLD